MDSKFKISRPIIYFGVFAVLVIIYLNARMTGQRLSDLPFIYLPYLLILAIVLQVWLSSTKNKKSTNNVERTVARSASLLIFGFFGFIVLLIILLGLVVEGVIL